MHGDIDPYPETGYDQALRPQFHFTSKRNWINDPNGLVYYAGEYHLFFQHNPKGREWGNMTWGHAVSPDLLHWKQIQHALMPDEHGTIFSGSAVVDWADTAGFKSGEEDVIVAAYTCCGAEGNPARPHRQAIAYSNDRGRTFAKYAGNPVLENISGGEDRDPKVFWHMPTGQWVMVLYLDKRKTLGIFASKNLKEWTLMSELGEFYECPELFELAVDGNKEDTRWVIHGADYAYLIGRFDGRKFTPEHEQKRRYQYGAGYASQTFNDAPDGRRLQMGWGRIQMKGMPFNQMMLFPVELSLRGTADGIRLFAEPIRELAKLRGDRQASAADVTIADGAALNVSTSGDLFEIDLEVEPREARSLSLEFNGVKFTYDAKEMALHGAPLKPVNGKVAVKLLIDRPSVEIFANRGAVNIAEALPYPGTISELSLSASGGEAKVVSLSVTELGSVWRDRG